VKQSAGQSNQAAANTPNPAFAATTSTNNVCIGAVANGVNPATMTPTTGWTEAHDVGVATPITGLETQFINSGFVGTTVTWGSTFGGPNTGADLIAELDTSSSAGGRPIFQPIPFIPQGRSM